tara:strand:- start:15 stop:677 length:663 start_codon:yes stop_codon:yes gene_type:complete
MFKHKWKVKLLTELQPKKNSNVLGLNVNRSVIKIRLRVSKEGGFYPYTHHLGTMLHELAHMKYGNHSAEFYDLLKELRDDMGKILNGRMAVPFFEAGCGIRLGGKRPRDSREIRRARLRKLQSLGNYRSLIGAGAYRLGGGTTTTTTTTNTSSKPSSSSSSTKRPKKRLKRTNTPPAKRREKFLSAVMKRNKIKKKSGDNDDDVIDLTGDDDEYDGIVRV